MEAPMRRRFVCPRPAGAALLLAFGLTACAGTATNPPGMLGYGTPGIESYVSEDQAPTLQALLERCQNVPQAGAGSQTSGLPAACNQLQRTAHNQPGNTVR